ncbi:MAG: AmmeMemoRadiSam system protein A [archaeon]
MLGEYIGEDGKEFVKLARESIKSKFSGEKIELPKGAKFRQARGVFVTLHKNEKLRGCIGLPYPTKAVCEAIVEAAKSAAFSDPRFSSVKESELDEIKIEVSVLTMPVKCSASEVEVGKDGLMCEYLGYSGLLLPQVASENNMDRIQFLEVLCQKACLPKDSWQKEKFKLYRFQAQIFSEEEGEK